MRKIYSLFMLLLVSIVAMGTVVTPDEARQKVAQFMSPRRASAVFQAQSALRLVTTSHYQVNAKTLAPSYYVFNIGQSEGYVIAAADDRLPVVLGYSSKGEFNPDNMPDNMKAWLKSYNDQMEYLNQHPEAAAPRRTVNGHPIAPLIQSHWNQQAPYNNLCPLDSTTRSLTGCVATAMAQIMNFWRYPTANTIVIPGYVTSKNKIKMPDIPAGTTIDWDNIELNYTGKETPAQQQAIANLMLLCGTSVMMDYSATFSGANGNDVANALRTYFNYDLSTKFENHFCYTAEEWNQKVYDELAAGRPVYYDGSSSSTGHAFIVDGYGGDDYFHINWGWGGKSDDYFLLSILNPYNNSAAGSNSSKDGFSFDQSAIFGAQPNTGVTPTDDPMLTVYNSTLSNGTVFTRKSINEDFEFTVGFSFRNSTTSTYTFAAAAGLFNVDGQFLGILNGFMNVMDPGAFFPAEMNSMPIHLGKGTDNAMFVISPICSLDEGKNWKPTIGSDRYYILGKISGNTLQLAGPVFDLAGTLTADGKKEVGSSLPLTASITNKGTFYKGEIFLTVDGKMVYGRHFDIKAGSTETVNLSYIPVKKGKQEVSLCTRVWNEAALRYDLQPFITDSVDIQAASANDLTINCKILNTQYGWIPENRILLKAYVTNNGDKSYDEPIKFIIYKDAHDGTTYFNYFTELVKTVHIDSKQTVEVDFNFENIGDDNYIIVNYYLSNANWVEANVSPMLTVTTADYFMVSDLNSWNTIDRSWPFTKQDDGKTWAITFKTPNNDMYLKVAPAATYLDQDNFWNNLLCAPEDRWTELTGNMVVNGGAWKIPAALNAETVTMRIVPAEMTYEMTYTTKTDGIESVGSDPTNGNAVVYSIDGNKLIEVKPANSREILKSLPKGIYIVRIGHQAKVVRN